MRSPWTGSTRRSSVSRCCSATTELQATGIYTDRLIYERGGWYFTSRELEWDRVPRRERAAGVSEGIRYEFAFGTYEDALRMVGTRTAPRFAGTAVSGARIQHFASMVRDPNPSYWDADFAAQAWGGLLAPPALLMGWLIPPPWLPTTEPPMPSIAIRVPLPGTTFINASNDVEFPTTILEGDRLHVIEEVVSVSPEKTTRLGTGHFVETCDQFHRADGTLVAINRTPCSASPRRTQP